MALHHGDPAGPRGESTADADVVEGRIVDAVPGDRVAREGWASGRVGTGCRGAPTTSATGFGRTAPVGRRAGMDAGSGGDRRSPSPRPGVVPGAAPSGGPTSTTTRDVMPAICVMSTRQSFVFSPTAEVTDAIDAHPATPYDADRWGNARCCTSSAQIIACTSIGGAQEPSGSTRNARGPDFANHKNRGVS